MRVLWHDLRYAARQLRRHPAFTVTAVLVLGLGIGVGTAMFSVLQAVLLRPLPYAHPERLVTLEHPRYPGNIEGNASGPDARDWQARSRSLQQIAYSGGSMVWLRLADGTHFVEDEGASASLFSTLGVTPRLGRGFTTDEQSRRAHVLVLSDTLWRQFFHARSDVIGQEVSLSGVGYTVVGVMPGGFTFPYGDINLWTPYAPAPEYDARDANLVRVIGRLRPGVSAASAQAEMSGIQAAIARQYSGMHLADRVLVRGYHDEVVGGVRPALLALGAAVGLVWLIACFSVAGLLLTRFAERRRELALRAALGASQTRLAAQLLAECLLLAWLAAGCGIALAFFAMANLRHFLLTRLPAGTALRLDGAMLLGLLGVTAASVVLIGLAPALLAAWTPPQHGLRGSGATSSAGSRGQSRLRDGLVIGEIALALLLLAGAGVLLQSLYRLRHVPLGFTTENVVTTSLLIPAGRFAHENMNQIFDEPLLAKLDALPGVKAAAITSVIPLERGFTMTGSFGYVGRPNLPDSQKPQGDVRFTSPGYTEVFGLRLERGRFFDASLDTLTSPRVLVVNHTFAQKYFPGEDPIGQQISIGSKQAATIVGVLGDARETALDAPPHPVMHFSTTQIAPGDDFYPMASAFASLAVRTNGPATALVAEMRTALHGVAPDLAVGDFDSMTQIVSDSIGSQILAARLLGLFAAAALGIALTGLYGLLAYTVGQRRREMGIRMALGAERHQIVRLVLGRAQWLLGVGITLGVGAALGLSRLLAAYLYGVPPRDPWTLATVALLLGACGMWAAYLPARRAARISPLEALRGE